MKQLGMKFTSVFNYQMAPNLTPIWKREAMYV